MQSRFMGASRRSNSSSLTCALMVAPTPPLFVDSSKIQSLLVRSRLLAIVSMSRGLRLRSSIKSMSNPSSWIASIAPSDSFTPCKYVNTVTALPASTLAWEASCNNAALFSAMQFPRSTGPFDSFIILTGAKRKQGPLSRIMLFVNPYAASGEAAVQIFKPGIPITYAWKGWLCSAPRAWFGAVPPAPMMVRGMSNCPPVVA
mmetsp:Transcript_3471/g.5911  ORF Transcript_3471/g.5911 Transcript_3471/m.5911 type:complete len:202 (-) Transcript_3471:264-869(-)